MNRTSIQTDIEYNVKNDFNKTYGYPDDMDDAIKAKRYAENDIVIATNERDGKLVAGSTKLLETKLLFWMFF